MRGLKLGDGVPGHALKPSHPVRVRGLKQNKAGVVGHRPAVAPRAGAWIETIYDETGLPLVCVAPRAGAWIETVNCQYN